MDHTTKIKPNQSVLALIPLDRPKKKKFETIKEFTKRETKFALVHFFLEEAVVFVHLRVL